MLTGKVTRSHRTSGKTDEIAGDGTRAQCCTPPIDLDQRSATVPVAFDPRQRVLAGGDILDPDGDDVTATQLTVNRQIEHGRESGLQSGVSSGSTRRVWAAGRLRPRQLPLVSRHSPMGLGVRDHLILHGHTARLQRTRSMCRRLGLGHWNQVSFLAITDFASGSTRSDGSRLTRKRHRGEAPIDSFLVVLSGGRHRPLYLRSTHLRR